MTTLLSSIQRLDRSSIMMLILTVKPSIMTILLINFGTSPRMMLLQVSNEVSFKISLLQKNRQPLQASALLLITEKLDLTQLLKLKKILTNLLQKLARLFSKNWSKSLSNFKVNSRWLDKEIWMLLFSLYRVSSAKDAQNLPNKQRKLHQHLEKSLIKLLCTKHSLELNSQQLSILSWARLSNIPSLQ